MNNILLEIYDELYALNKNNIMAITLEDEDLKPLIKISARKNYISKTMMKSILKICDISGAKMKMLPHEVIVINF